MVGAAGRLANPEPVQLLISNATGFRSSQGDTRVVCGPHGYGEQAAEMRLLRFTGAASRTRVEVGYPPTGE